MSPNLIMVATHPPTLFCLFSGIWTKHLRLQTGIEKAQFTKVIKKLENKKLIKSVNSVSATKRKFYMLCVMPAVQVVPSIS